MSEPNSPSTDQFESQKSNAINSDPNGGEAWWNIDKEKAKDKQMDSNDS